MTNPLEASSDRSAKLRELNDTLRHTMQGGHVYFTRGVLALGQPFAGAAIEAVRKFSRFTENNDPYGEHDFGAFDIAGARLYWKIDYYDLSLAHGSPDPSDPAKTRRVLTILLSEEY